MADLDRFPELEVDSSLGKEKLRLLAAIGFFFLFVGWLLGGAFDDIWKDQQICAAKEA
jgi:hypothetical protein